MEDVNFVDPCPYYLTPSEVFEYSDRGQCANPKNYYGDCDANCCPFKFSVEHLMRFRLQMVDFDIWQGVCKDEQIERIIEKTK